MGSVVDSVKDLFVKELRDQFTQKDKKISTEREISSQKILNVMKNKWIIYLIVFESLTILLVCGHSISFCDNIDFKILTKNLSLCFASQFVGIIVGFLFGIPKTPESLDNGQFKLLVLKNTNLEQVSDWLTKLLLGASLAQHAEIIDLIERIGFAFGATGTDSYYFGVGAIIFTFIGGFLLAFLFASLLLTYGLGEMVSSQMKEARNNIENVLNTQVAEKINEELEKIDNNKNSEKYNGMADETIDDATRNDINSYNSQIRVKAKEYIPDSYEYDSDPWKGKFGKKAFHDDIELTAKVTSDSNSLYRIEIKLEGKKQGVLPENSFALFLIHPTFSNYKRFVKVHNNVAQLVLYSAGSFTVGALALGGEQKFELDLATLPNVPLKFRES